MTRTSFAEYIRIKGRYSILVWLQRLVQDGVCDEIEKLTTNQRFEETCFWLSQFGTFCLEIRDQIEM